MFAPYNLGNFNKNTIQESLPIENTKSNSYNSFVLQLFGTKNIYQSKIQNIQMIGQASEQQMAQELRITIRSKLVKLDLPGFMELELDNMLNSLNYYKLKNFESNLEDVKVTLTQVRDNYLMTVFKDLQIK